MYERIHSEPLSCSQCGSINCVNPINDPMVAVRCEDCGHTKPSQFAIEQEQANRPPITWSSNDTARRNSF